MRVRRGAIALWPRGAVLDPRGGRGWAPLCFLSQSEDWSAEFCRTVADCPRLLAVRSWSWLVVILMLIGVALLTCSCLCLAVAWAKEKHLEQRGFRCGLLALLAFTLGAALYLYVAKADLPTAMNSYK